MSRGVLSFPCDVLSRSVKITFIPTLKEEERHAVSLIKQKGLGEKGCKLN
jgi:hypothetical protein